MNDENIYHIGCSWDIGLQQGMYPWLILTQEFVLEKSSRTRQEVIQLKTLILLELVTNVGFGKWMNMAKKYINIFYPLQARGPLEKNGYLFSLVFLQQERQWENKVHCIMLYNIFLFSILKHRYSVELSNLISLCDSILSKGHIVWFQKISIPPPWGELEIPKGRGGGWAKTQKILEGRGVAWSS